MMNNKNKITKLKKMNILFSPDAMYVFEYIHE